MHKKITKGKVIAGVLALLIAGFFWGVFFPPGGSGANILLGIFVAVFFVYYFAQNIGGLIDQEIFPGGTRERARKFRSLEKFIKESKEHLSAIKKSKRKRKNISQKALDNFEKEILQSGVVLSTVASEWKCTDAKMHEHEKSLEQAHDRLETASKAIFKLDRNWRFLYGVPSLVFALFCALLIREFVVEPYQIPSGSMIPSLLVGDHLFVSKYYYGLSKPFTSEPDFLVQWRSPKPGDVVIFKAPDYVGRHAGQAWIKRVIATEGQTIKISNNVVYVDGKPYEHITKTKSVEYMDFFGFGGPNGGQWRKQTALRGVEKIGDVEHSIHVAKYPPSPKLGPYWPIPGDYNYKGLDCSSIGCKVKEGHIFVMGDNRGNSADSRIWGALPVSRIKGKAWFVWMSVDGSRQSVKLGPFNLPRFRFERWFTKIK